MAKIWNAMIAENPCVRSTLHKRQIFANGNGLSKPNKCNPRAQTLAVCAAYLSLSSTFLGMASSYSPIMGCHGHHHHWKCIGTAPSATAREATAMLRSCLTYCLYLDATFFPPSTKPHTEQFHKDQCRRIPGRLNKPQNGIKQRLKNLATKYIFKWQHINFYFFEKS